MTPGCRFWRWPARSSLPSTAQPARRSSLARELSATRDAAELPNGLVPFVDSDRVFHETGRDLRARWGEGRTTMLALHSPMSINAAIEEIAADLDSGLGLGPAIEITDRPANRWTGGFAVSGKASRKLIQLYPSQVRVRTNPWGLRFEGQLTSAIDGCDLRGTLRPQLRAFPDLFMAAWVGALSVAICLKLVRLVGQSGAHEPSTRSLLHLVVLIAFLVFGVGARTVGRAVARRSAQEFKLWLAECLGADQPRSMPIHRPGQRPPG